MAKPTCIDFGIQEELGAPDIFEQQLLAHRDVFLKSKGLKTSVTLHEAIPDWYEIKVKYTTGGKMRKYEVPRYSQTGNAIPPLFAELAWKVSK